MFELVTYKMNININIPIEVTCAVIVNENQQILAVRRGPEMQMPFKWEFPGGKIEQDETEEDCIIREIIEELSIKISIIRRLEQNVHHYDSVSICLIPFLCTISEGEIVLSEHDRLCWLPKEKLLTLDWAEADIPIVKEVQKLLL